MQVWWTSDTHFGHANIIKYCNRPFKSLQEMDETIINNFNARVKEDDMCFFLGDFCFKKSTEASDSPKNAFDFYRDKLNCKNIIFVAGNHDGRNGTKSIIQRCVIEYGGKRMNMCHDPEHSDFRYEINLVGHVHQNWQIYRFRVGEQFTDCINVGVDVWGFKPIKIGEILSEYIKYQKRIK